MASPGSQHLPFTLPGVSYNVLARATGVSVATVKRRIASASSEDRDAAAAFMADADALTGLEMSAHRKRRGMVPLIVRRAIAALAGEGWTNRELARAFSVSLRTVSRCRREAIKGYKLPRGERVLCASQAAPPPKGYSGKKPSEKTIGRSFSDNTV